MKKSMLIMLILIPGWVLSQGLEERLISLRYKDVPLGIVLKDLTDHHDIKVSYSSSRIPVNELVTIDLEQAPLSRAMKVLFQGLPVAYHLDQDHLILKFVDLKQTVRGRVVDKESQIPIIGATVVLVNSDPLKGGVTDVNGEFRIENVQVGRKSFAVNYIGYEPKNIYNVLIGTGKETVLNIEIVESVIQMEELVVTAIQPGSPPLNELAVISARSFTTEETQRYAASVGDPGRLATAYAGVTTGDDGTNELVIRGNSPRGLLWMLEGVEIPSPNHFTTEGSSSGGISMLSTQVMAPSDFYTGAFPAQYGNALSGVFDINLREGNDQKNENTFQAGLLGIDIATEGPWKRGKKGSYLVNYRYSTLAILDNVGFNVMDDTEKNIFQDMSFKMIIPTKKAGRFSLFGLGGISTFEEDVPASFTDLETYNMGVAGISNMLFINSNTFLRTTAAISGTNVKDELVQIFNNGLQTVSDKSEFKKSFFTLTSALHRKINAQHYVETGVTFRRLGYDYSNEIINPFNQPPFDQFGWFQDNGSANLFQGYGTWKNRLTENLSLITGLNIMYFQLNGETSVEPRIAMEWKLNKGQKISAAYGIHSRIESLQFYLGRFTYNDGTSAQQNRDLGFTKAHHYVIGYQNQLSPFTFLKAEMYYQKLFNVPVLTQTDDFPFSTILVSNGFTVLPLDNTGSAKNYGIELTLERAFAKGYYFMVNGALYEAKYTARDGIERNSRFNGNFINNILAGKEWKVGKNGKNNILGINIKSTYAGNKRFTPIDLNQSIQQGMEVRDLTRVYAEKYPDFYRMDLQVIFRKNKPSHTSEWRLDILNITDRRNILEDWFSNRTQSIRFETQLPLIPVLSYRVEF